jgi:hypothetical protein
MSTIGKPPDNWRRAQRRLKRREARQRLSKPVLISVIAAVVVIAVATTISVLLASQPISSRYCLKSFVPAYFTSGTWSQVTSAKPVPSVMILNPSTGIGAGNAPDPGFQAAVRRAQAAGTKVLGYASTANGQRPLSQIEADVRNYRAWYKVNGIFLDSVSGTSSDLSYYQQLDSYIHDEIHGSKVWLNPGIYPEQAYMSVGDVLMVFEGTYDQYRNIQVPGWARKYPATRFANTIYNATSSAEAGGAISLAKNSNAGYVFVTDLSLPNPYLALPSYWSSEHTAITAACRASAG